VIGAPTPTEGIDVVSATRAPVIVTRPEPEVEEHFPNGGRPLKLPRRRLGRYPSAMLALVTVVASAAAVARVRAGVTAMRPVFVAPVLVTPPLRLDGALVLGASRDWVVNKEGPLRYGDPVPVSLTAYCLRGLTRRDHYVREGIVASDPKHFPLGRYLEIYVGKQYYGRFLIDDTGGVIKGNKLDIWAPSCREARLFGRVKGTAVLVPKPRGSARDTLTTGRLGGRKPERREW
jgi:3D (Asp-Asp-Asp) domain-containing protein